MFETEAEEYFNKTYNDIMIRNRSTVIKAFQDGAEFGYNKCFEQIRKIVNEQTRLDCIIPELLRLKESE